MSCIPAGFLEQPEHLTGGHVPRAGRAERKVRRDQLRPRVRLRHADAQAQDDTGKIIFFCHFIR